jgi:hypothetical protein
MHRTSAVDTTETVYSVRETYIGMVLDGDLFVSLHVELGYSSNSLLIVEDPFLDGFSC